MEPVNQERLREQLKNELSGESYQVYHQNDSWLDRIREWIGDRLANLLPQVDISPQVTNGVTYGIIGVGILLFLLFMWVFVRRVVRQTRFDPKPVGSAADFSQTTRQHLSQADDLAKQGDYSEAFRHVFLACLLDLEQKRGIEIQPWKSNGEYYDDIQRHRPEDAAFFYELAMRFDAAMYGRRPVTAETYRSYRDKMIRWMKEDEEGTA